MFSRDTYATQFWLRKKDFFQSLYHISKPLNKIIRILDKRIFQHTLPGSTNNLNHTVRRKVVPLEQLMYWQLLDFWKQDENLTIRCILQVDSLQIRYFTVYSYEIFSLAIILIRYIQEQLPPTSNNLRELVVFDYQFYITFVAWPSIFSKKKKCINWGG